MFNGSVKNFVTNDVSGFGCQAEPAKVGRSKAEGGTVGFAEAVDMAIAAEIAAELAAHPTENPHEGSHGVALEADSTVTSETKIAQAGEIIANAIAKISEMINLPVEIRVDPKQRLEFDPESLDQFADILWALDKVIKLFDGVATAEKLADLGWNIDGETADQSDIAAICADLRKEKFHIELGFRLMEAHELIVSKISEKHGSDTVSGVAQAANPNDLTMTTSDLAKAFGSLIREEMASTMDRVRELTSGQAEMTELEKAAVELGTANSEILKVALKKVKTFNFDNINLNTNADASNVTKDAGAETEAEADISVNTKADVKIDTKVNVNADTKADANINANISAAANTTAKASADNFELPISSKESAHRNKRENVESANRKAFRSVEEMSAKIISVTDTATEIPISAAESTNKKILTDNIVKSKPASENTDLHIASARTAAAGTFAELPVESLDDNTLLGAVLGVKKNQKTGYNYNNENNEKITNQTKKHASETVQNIQQAAAVTHKKAERENIVTTASGASADASDNHEKTQAPNHNNVSANVKTDANIPGSLLASIIEDGAELENTADTEDPESGVSTDPASSRTSGNIDKTERAPTMFSRFENEAIVRQLTEKMHHAIRAGAHEVRMILRPESLGEVRMSLRVEGDVVMARMEVENRQVKAILESNLQMLKDALEKNNLHLEGFSVDVGSDSNRPTHEIWREMAENSGSRQFKADADGSIDGTEEENEAFATAPGSDTGRRFGNNTFEYFI
ncbi:MAG: flagellar hook-length control protein FliK [Chitinispirillales bacterium]|jgi:flagellar hook-length control protein FliK|nr:flagellar hook-length control protein FliK [Chitinispirillales bacterium]